MSEDMIYKCIVCGNETLVRRADKPKDGRLCSKCNGHVVPNRYTDNAKHSKGIGSVTVSVGIEGYEKMKGQLRNLEATYDRILEKQDRVSKGLNAKDKDITINESNEAYIKAVKCWLRKQDIEKKRNIQDIAMTKEQAILDDEVTRLAIVDFNVWAKENGAEEI